MSNNENALQKVEQTRDELISVLQTSLYSGAKKESVELVLSYCEATNLDPMQKPVHIVPMNVRNAQTGNYEWRDIIMPGIGLYRIQADRSGSMAGISEPTFGEERTIMLKDKNKKDVTCSFPEWCKVTVKKIVGTHIVEFVAKEYWLENYATDSGSSEAPNKMWKKRPRGQLAKCAEAQALRKAFPEVGAAPTAEEMEGKVIEVSSELIEGPAVDAEPVPMSDDKFNEKFPAWEKIIKDGKQSPEEMLTFLADKEVFLSDDQINRINKVKVEFK
jgi:phage recombination protein Bet